MLTILLKEFIRTGNFGSITIGSAKKDVINLLGKPHGLQIAVKRKLLHMAGMNFFIGQKLK
jgi:hypothetical protein